MMREDRKRAEQRQKKNGEAQAGSTKDERKLYKAGILQQQNYRVGCDPDALWKWKCKEICKKDILCQDKDRNRNKDTRRDRS